MVVSYRGRIDEMKQLFVSCIIVILLLFIGTFVYSIHRYFMNPKGSMIDGGISKRDHDISEICLDGHVYYRLGGHSIQGGIAPKLDYNGKPYKCE